MTTRGRIVLVAAALAMVAAPACLGGYLWGGWGLAGGLALGVWAVAAVPSLMMLYAMSQDGK